MMPRGAHSNGRRPLALSTMCAAVVLVTAAWALWPLGSAELPVPELARKPDPTPRMTVALDMAAFRAPVWFVPPPPPAPPREPEPSKPPPLPPLKLELIAIERYSVEGSPDQSAHRAMLFDPDANQILVLAKGDSAGPTTIELVTAESVQIRTGAAVRTLHLAPPPVSLSDLLDPTSTPGGGKPRRGGGGVGTGGTSKNKP